MYDYVWYKIYDTLTIHFFYNDINAIHNRNISYTCRHMFSDIAIHDWIIPLVTVVIWANVSMSNIYDLNIVVENDDEIQSGSTISNKFYVIVWICATNRHCNMLPTFV